MAIISYPKIEDDKLRLNDNFIISLHKAKLYAGEDKISITHTSDEDYKTAFSIPLNTPEKIVTWIKDFLNKTPIRTTSLFTIQSIKIDVENHSNHDANGVIEFAISEREENFKAFVLPFFNEHFLQIPSYYSNVFKLKTKELSTRESQISKIQNVFNTIQWKFVNTKINTALKRLNHPDFPPSKEYQDIKKAKYHPDKEEKKPKNHGEPLRIYEIYPDGTLRELIMISNRILHLEPNYEELKQWLEDPTSLKGKQEEKIRSYEAGS